MIEKNNISSGVVTLNSAFLKDPLWEKLFSGIENEQEKRKAFFEVPLRQGIVYGNVYTPSANLEGICVVIPGKFVNSNLWHMIRTGSLGAVSRMGVNLSKKLSQMFQPMISEHKALEKQGEYLYISILGVGEDFQGKGFGGKILKMALEESKRKTLPLYLETETEENVKFYEKHGFRVTKNLVLPVVNHKMWQMVFEP